MVDKRYRNLGIIVVIIAVALAAFFLMPEGPVAGPGPLPSFSTDYSDLTTTWRSEGLSEPSLQSNFSELLALPSSKLAAIKANLQQFEAAHNEPASKELAVVYIALVEVAEKTKEIEELNNAIDSSVPVCDNVASFKSINVKKKSLIESANEFDAAVVSFTQNFPAEAGEINLDRLGTDFGDISSSLDEDHVMIALLETEC